MPTARSIIAIAVGYPNKLKGAPKSVRGDRRGMFARASWGQDYHSIMRKRLDKLADFIQSKVPDVELKVWLILVYYQIGPLLNEQV